MATSDITKDLEAMNSVLANPETPEPKKEEIPPEPKPEEKEEVIPEEEKKEEVKEESKGEVTTPPESKKEEEKADPLATLNQTIAELKSEIASLKAGKQEVQPPESPKPEEPKIEDKDFVGELDLDEVSRDSKQLNSLLNKVYREGMIASNQAIIGKLPDLVKGQIQAINAMQEAGKNFYAENEDLKAFPKVVTTVYDELAKANPKSTLGEVLKQTATEVRKRLNLPAPKPEEKKEEPKTGGKPPVLPSKGSSSGRPKDKPETNTLQSELDEMNKVVKE
jgi:hypothetical protein